MILHLGVEMEINYYNNYAVSINDDIGVAIYTKTMASSYYNATIFIPYKYYANFLTALVIVKDNFNIYKELSIVSEKKEWLEPINLYTIVLVHCIWERHNYVYISRNVKLEYFFCTTELQDGTLDYFLNIYVSVLRDEDSSMRNTGFELNFHSTKEIEEFINAII